MLNRSKILIVAILLTGSAFTAAGAIASPGRVDFGEVRLERMAERLQLSEVQLSQIRAIVDEARPGLRAYRDQLRDNRQQLRELDETDSADDNALRTLADEQGDLIADMIVARSQMQRAIRAVLTPEQQAQAEQFKTKRRHYHGRRF